MGPSLLGPYPGYRHRVFAQQIKSNFGARRSRIEGQGGSILTPLLKFQTLYAMTAVGGVKEGWVDGWAQKAHDERVCVCGVVCSIVTQC
jgi:hypothetical protein